MLRQPLDAVKLADLKGLVSSETSEGHDLEFKRDLPDSSDDAVKEFLADVTSLANSQGGDLIFGIEETDGVATAAVGVKCLDHDRAILRLENMLRDCADPRVPGVATRWFAMTSDTGMLVVRVPTSFAAPHRVKHKKISRFYARNSRGKYEMDTGELRAAFSASEGLPSRFRELHRIAVQAARGMEMPFSVDEGPKRS